MIWASPGFWRELRDKIYNDVGGCLIFILWANYFDHSSQLWWVRCSSCAQHDNWEWQLDMTFWHLRMAIQNATISRQKAKEHGGMKPSISNKNKFMDSRERLSTISNRILNQNKDMRSKLIEVSWWTVPRTWQTNNNSPERSRRASWVPCCTMRMQECVGNAGKLGWWLRWDVVTSALRNLSTRFGWQGGEK